MGHTENVKVKGGDGSTYPWSVFDGVKSWPSSPEVLMAEIDSAIAISEYARTSSLLNSSSSSSSPPPIQHQQEQQEQRRFDARLADEAYKAGCAALAAGKLDDALGSLQTSFSLCPPDKASAIAKLRTLISFVSQQKQQQSKPASS